jgi:protein-tyrosine phosphatase
VIGHAIHDRAATVLEELGGEATNFVARQLTTKIASDADLVLTMTKAHRDTVLELAPRMLRRTFTLVEAARLVLEGAAQSVPELAERRGLVAADQISDIPDPVGQSAEVFREVGSEIAALLPAVLSVST